MRIGIDLGGTNIRMALVDNGVIIKKISEACLAKESEEVVVNQIKNIITQLINPEVDGIGVGVPSVVDTEQGIIYDVMNIPSWKEVHLKSILEREFNIPVGINNDCNCFVFGEYFFGLSDTYKDVLGLTLGTGLGCGIIVDGKLYNGQNTGAGEICAIPYLNRDYEYYCSTDFFADQNKVVAKDVFEKAKNGDSSALELWREFGVHIGNLVKTVILAYDPQCIVIGGSIANAMPFFEQSMYNTMKDFSYPKSVERLKIYRSKVEDAAILGAAML